MASPALTSLSETRPKEISWMSNYTLTCVVKVSLRVVKYFSKRINTNEGLKLVEMKIRKAACEAEYILQEFKQGNLQSTNMLLSKIDDLDLFNTYLLKTLGLNFFNREEYFSSYVVSSSSSNLYQVHHNSFYGNIDDRSSPIRMEKGDIVDFLIAKSKLSPDLEFVVFSSDEKDRIIDNMTLVRCIYTDSRIKSWFPMRAWFTNFPALKDVLKNLLRFGMDLFPNSGTYWPMLDEMSLQQLGECVRKYLVDHRYLIVIEGTCSYERYKEITYSFRDMKNGSRVLFIDDFEMASGITSITFLVLPCFENVLKMFRNLVFGERSFPAELEIMVRDIIHKCNGSLCEVFMVAKYMSTINQTADNWRIVQETIQKERLVGYNMIPGIISALLKASENIISIDAEKTGVYLEKCETINMQPNIFELLKDSSKVAGAKDYEQVGFEECLNQLVSELLRSSTQLERLAIVGMAGIGKTTLAKTIYDDPSISHHFHVRAWIGISQFYRKRSLLIQLLQSITQLTDNEILNEADAYLEAKLYRCLKGQRYLIVMDDIWSTKALWEFKRIFPDDKMGSRILLTSRESNLIEGLNCKIVHRMSLLNEKKSWDLLKKKVFGQEICPQGLAVIGKQIAKRCEGLPLAIVVVAGVLLKTGKTVHSWKIVADAVSSHVMSSECAPRAMFALSYEHLPDYLKSCFLYIGAFPGGHEIEVRMLIRLWIAEGFIANAYPKSLEEVAEEYLNDLVDRNLLLSGRTRSNGRLRTCRLHDLVLEFCIQEARREYFMNVIQDFRLLDSKTTTDAHHRLSFHCHNFDDVHLTASKSHAGSAFFFGVSSDLVPDILLHYFDFKLLRVLDFISWHFDNFPTEQVAKLLLLRYLALTASFELPGTLFKLQNLQTLIINGPWLKNCKIPELPPEFWKSTNLRHLQLRMVTHLSSPEKPTEAEYLKTLQTLTTITLASCSHRNFCSVFNILKLGVCETYEDFLVVGLWDRFFQNILLLERVQILKLSCFGHNRPLPLPSLDPFPKSLKKLSLRQSNLPWEAMTLICELPNLEVLKLRNNAFRGQRWETREGGFHHLKYLMIEETDLMYWELESDHFPRLEQLVLKSCKALEKIPSEIADIHTLTHIKLENCKSSVEMSAKDIQEQCNEYSQVINIQIRNRKTLPNASVEDIDE